MNSYTKQGVEQSYQRCVRVLIPGMWLHADLFVVGINRMMKYIAMVHG